MNADAILAKLRALGSEEQSVNLSRFFKTAPGQYGSGDKFFGVKVPVTRSVAKTHADISFDDIQRLLDSPWHEARLCGLLILVIRFQNRKTADVEREEIFHFYLKNAQRCNNWDLVDLSAPTVVGGFLLGKNHELLYELADSNNLWKQRIAIVSTMTFIRHDDFEDVFALTLRLRSHPHDLIHKALGWMLREVGKRNKKVLCDFLSLHATELPRTTLRYAIERFSPEERQSYLLMKRS